MGMSVRVIPGPSQRMRGEPLTGGVQSFNANGVETCAQAE